MFGQQFPVRASDDFEVEAERATNFRALFPGYRQQFCIAVHGEIADEAEIAAIIAIPAVRRRASAQLDRWAADPQRQVPRARRQRFDGTTQDAAIDT
jgi:hypothetical protein